MAYWRQAITWRNAGLLLIGTLGTNFSESLSEIQKFLLKKMHLKMSAAKWWQCCLDLYGLINAPTVQARMESECPETCFIPRAWHMRMVSRILRP